MTAEVANRLGHPAQTVLRSLQDMAAHGLVQQWRKPGAAGEEKSTQTVPLAALRPGPQVGEADRVVDRRGDRW